jgi:hypothetical protein
VLLLLDYQHYVLTATRVAYGQRRPNGPNFTKQEGQFRLTINYTGGC